MSDMIVICVGGTKDFSFAIWGILHPAVLYEAKQCCTRPSSAVRGQEHCWHSTPAYTEKA